MEQHAGIKKLTIQILFWIFFGESVYLFWNSLNLYYSIGYKTKFFIYLIFIGISIVYLSYSGVFKKISQRKWGCSSVLYLTFFTLPIMILLPSIFEVTDFDDETLFLNEKYRIVSTSDVIMSGGQSYIAVLKREGKAEHCIYKSEMRHWDKSRIITVDEKVGLVANNEEGSRLDTIWIEQ